MHLQQLSSVLLAIHHCAQLSAVCGTRVQALVVDPKPGQKSMSHTSSGSSPFGGQTPAEVLQGAASVRLCTCMPPFTCSSNLFRVLLACRLSMLSVALVRCSNCMPAAHSWLFRREALTPCG